MNQSIRVYDFKKPQRYSIDNMRFLSVLSEDYCKTISLYIKYELKKQNIKFKLEKVEQTNYEEFMHIIPNDSIIVEHSILPLVKNLIYQIDKSTVLTLIDLMLGGDGLFDNYKRELTEIDKELIFYMTNHFLKTLHIVEGCDSREVSKVHTNAGASQKFPVSESVLIAYMTLIRDGKEIGKMRFCNPYSCMEPVLSQLDTKNLFKDKKIEEAFEFANAMYNNICESYVEILARLGKASISVNELLNLQVGDIIELNTKIGGDITLSVGNSEAYKCKPGLIKNKKGVIITDSIEKDV